MKGRINRTPSTLNVILIMAILNAGGAFKKEVIKLIIILNGLMKIEKKIVVTILKKIEKCDSFLLSLFPVNIVISASKLVPIFAPKIRGIVLSISIILFNARSCNSAINREDDCNVAVKKVPIIMLKIKFPVARLIYAIINGFSFKDDNG